MEDFSLPIIRSIRRPPDSRIKWKVFYRSERIVWLLEELGIPYEIKHYKRQANYLAPKELKAIHPLGKAPVITDGDLVIAETGNLSFLLKSG